MTSNLRLIAMNPPQANALVLNGLLAVVSYCSGGFRFSRLRRRFFLDYSHILQAARARPQCKSGSNIVLPLRPAHAVGVGFPWPEYWTLVECRHALVFRLLPRLFTTFSVCLSSFSLAPFSTLSGPYYRPLDEAMGSLVNSDW